MSMTERSFLGLGTHGFHLVAYTEWGAGANERVVVCVHGLTRSGRDFDWIAEALESDFRVACPDLPGAGRSHWLAQASEYGFARYLSDLATLIARLGVDTVDVIGTSLGGVLGMMLAAQPNTPIRRLVLNDIGAFVPKAGVQRISGEVGSERAFASVEALEAHLRVALGPSGPLTEAQWRHLAEHGSRYDAATSTWQLNYDPKLAHPLREGEQADFDLWSVWERVGCPVLVLRGAESDLLLKETAEEMLTRGPEAELIEFPGIGHAPMLMDSLQIEAVRAWLLA